MSSARIRKKQLSKFIAEQMGTRNKHSMNSSNPEIHQRFQPHSTYPLKQIAHEYSKLPMENIHNFVNLSELKNKLSQNPAINSLLKNHPDLMKSFEKSVMQAVRERGIKASKYWETAPKEYIDDIIAKGKGKPNEMNETLGRIAGNHFKGTTNPGIILDIGSFAGGTITSVVKNFSAEQKRNVKIVLVDVNKRVLRENAVPALTALGVPRQNIKVLPTGFHSASIAFKHMRKPFFEKGNKGFEKQFNELRGKVSMVVAGASTINFANDLNPFLKTIRSLLKKDGMFIDWEWGSAEARTPAVNLSKLKKTQIGLMEGKPVTEFQAYKSFLGFWIDLFNYPKPVKQKMFNEIEKSKTFNFIEWCEKNVKWMESQRINAGKKILADPAGFRNRAYRTGNQMYETALKHGFKASKPQYPHEARNWLITMKK
jgi:hypothetical protein